ncbi:ABC transporter ATP-binding protein [Chelatococcus sp. SYSU_G07232]|uniref:ABC transporter ATP-binding protein n=1 Tax=Chelatococcus albus TaxID=3047466 RepID=A0ABT7AH33_9HYPH|nr:ABC transporter ATP-binding protein [Chelatococcus sp. SYSU_G07232]MDJ1158686.1 ABC transporter ATP-binding protein [Chelatococcus sp. SYSU_G07232]
MSFLKLENVSKFYGPVGAVIDMDLAVEKGEFVSLLGPSGCGKTTTLQMIAGFVEASRGTIRLDGRDITRAKPNKRGLGIVFQSYALFPHMSVFDNVAFGLEMRRVPKAERRERVNAALALVRLDAHADRYPRELSGGQRVALARALVIEPPVLLLDEPLSNLDAQLREEMQFELRQIQRKVGTTTIMVTHDQAEALSISDRIVVMQAGRVTQVDEPYRMYEHPRTRFISTFVGKANLVAGRVRAEGADLVADLGATKLALPAADLAPGEEIILGIRPEKLTFVAPGRGRLDGTVVERFFLGSQWLYRVATELGDLVLTRPNDGLPAVAEATIVGIDWPTEHVRVLKAPAEPGAQA